jgi:hypothetical protein
VHLGDGEHHVKGGDDFDADELRERSICSSCVGETYLSASIEQHDAQARCDYCDKLGRCVSLATLADQIDVALEQHFVTTPIEPEGIEYLAAKEGRWERGGESVTDVIGEAASLEPEPAEHVRIILEDKHDDFERAQMGDEGPYDPETHYRRERPRGDELQAEWQDFQRSLRTEARMFNPGAHRFLTSLFAGIADYRTRDGAPVVVKAGPREEISALYRARVFQSQQKLETALCYPERELGPPPPAAARAGRMNAHGIAVFYGARSKDVAVAETRPPVGSHVAVARFKIVRPLTLLDIEALEEVYVEGSLFDPSHLGELKKAAFLRTVSNKIKSPVMPDDEPFEYLVTQAIADFLAGGAAPAIDGIIYPSVQDGGPAQNVALFHKAARVELSDLPRGTTTTASLWCDTEDADPEFFVRELLPGPQVQPEENKFDFAPWTSGEEADADTREPSLLLDIASVTVELVTAANFSRTSIPVHRERTTREDRDF